MSRKPKLLKYIWTKDSTPATLTTVTFSSNNTTTTLAKVGNIVTLAFVPSEVIQNIVVTIAGKNVAPTMINPLSYTVSYTLVTADTTGEIPFTIDFKDLNGVTGTQVVATTGTEIVTFDKTLPTLSSVTKTSVTVLNVVISELCLTNSITKANAGGFVVYETGTPGTTYAVSGVAPGVDNTHAVLTVADMTASAIPGVTVTYVAGGNGTVADLAGNLLATNATGVVTGAF